MVMKAACKLSFAKMCRNMLVGHLACARADKILFLFRSSVCGSLRRCCNEGQAKTYLFLRPCTASSSRRVPPMLLDTMTYRRDMGWNTSRSRVVDFLGIHILSLSEISSIELYVEWESNGSRRRLNVCCSCGLAGK